jgi:hypothetical protein
VVVNGGSKMVNNKYCAKIFNWAYKIFLSTRKKRGVMRIEKNIEEMKEQLLTYLCHELSKAKSVGYPNKFLTDCTIEALTILIAEKYGHCKVDIFKTMAITERYVKKYFDRMRRGIKTPNLDACCNDKDEDEEDEDYDD